MNPIDASLFVKRDLSTVYVGSTDNAWMALLTAHWLLWLAA